MEILQNGEIAIERKFIEFDPYYSSWYNQTIVFNCRINMFISAHILPEAFSLSMSDFQVPEFAHFGKRVVLKVRKQLIRWLDVDYPGYRFARAESIARNKLMSSTFLALFL